MRHQEDGNSKERRKKLPRMIRTRILHGGRNHNCCIAVGFPVDHYSPGAVCQWLFDTVTGIRVAGENRLEITPTPGGSLTRAGASYRSLYGEVRSRWEKTEAGIRYTISIPANCTAAVRLPGGRTETVTTGEYEYVESI